MFRKTLKSFSGLAFLVGALFFCLSLTPSLLPRPAVMQGALSGIVFAVGYGAGMLGLYLWRFLELPVLTAPTSAHATKILSAIAIIGAGLTLARAAVWQNSIRAVMDMEPIETADPFLIAGIAIAIALVLILVGRILIWVAVRFIRAVARFLPRRISIGLGSLAFGFLVFVLVDDFIIKRALSAMDSTFAALDAAIDEGVAAPTRPTSSGHSASVIAWDDIGRTGKNFIARGASAEAIGAFSGRPALDPVRIYAGFNSAETVEERAQLALADLIRAGGFDRSTLVVATATGTGWMDPAAVEPLAYLHNGDVAIVTLQYSYLPSWLTLIIHPNQSRNAASALFDAVYDHWTTLPPDGRPKLYLFGLSLGALGSEASVDLISLFDDPIDGALWVGPPFASTIWPQVTQGRADGSPAWRPIFRDGSLIRFMTRDGIATPVGASWGRMRLLYLQHPSDPMSFFSPDLAFSKPDWLRGRRGPDISPAFDWYPLVTFFQVAFDIPMATSVPPGYGHTFTADSYIDAWLEVMAPEGWSAADIARLKAHLAGLKASPI